MRLFKETAGVGRITKQNQTKDVGPNQVSKEAAKFGNKVDKDGRPPVLSKKVSGPKSNIAANLGLAEGLFTGFARVIKHLKSKGIKLTSKQESEIVALDKQMRQIDKKIKDLGSGYNKDLDTLKNIEMLQQQKREVNSQLMSIVKSAMNPSAAIKEGDLVLDKNSLMSYIKEKIMEYVYKEEDIKKLSQLLKQVANKEIKTRSGNRFTITDKDVSEIMENVKLSIACPPEKQQRIKEFALYCLEQLGISQAPRVKLVDDSGTTALGFTNTEDKSITVTVKDRHQMDIMRTLAHELVHYKQLETYMPDGSTGSPDENEANALAGVLLRNWGKANPNLFYEDIKAEWNSKKTLKEGKRHGNDKMYDKCWKGYKKVSGKKRGEKGSCEKVDEGWLDKLKNTFTNDPYFQAWYRIYKQDPQAAANKFPSKHDEYVKRVKAEVNEGWLDSLFGEDPLVPAPEWLHPKTKSYWEKIGPRDDGSFALTRLKAQLHKAKMFADSGLTADAHRLIVKELDRYAESELKETATAGATSAGAIASVANPVIANHNPKRDKRGVPKAPQKKNKDGTAKNALDISNNLMGGNAIKR